MAMTVEQNHRIELTLVVVPKCINFFASKLRIICSGFAYF